MQISKIFPTAPIFYPIFDLRSVYLCIAKLAFALAYRYIWLTPYILSLGKIQACLLLPSLIRIFATALCADKTDSIMKIIKLILVSAASLLFFDVSFAQFSLPVSDGVETLKGVDSVRGTKLYQDYFSRARYRAQRKALVKQRNTLEIGASVTGNMTRFNEHWKAGGDNTVNVFGSIWCYHTFKKNRFTLTTKLDMKYGQNFIKEEDIRWFKNQDEFKIQTSAGWAIGTEGWRRNWSYNVSAQFRSQFDEGYKSRATQKAGTLLSDFLSPGYFNLSVGMKYTSPDKRLPFVVSISPVAGDVTIAENENLRKSYGMKVKRTVTAPDGTQTPVYYSSKFSGGSSVQVDFDRTFYANSRKDGGKNKKEIFRYRTTIFAFYGWMTNLSEKRDPDYKELMPTVRWDNTIDVKATKFLSMQFTYQMFYDKVQIDKLQMKYYLSIGLSYKFKNK